MPNWSFLTRLMYQDCYKMVTITDKSKELIEYKHHLNNVQTIYNPINIEEIQSKYNESIDLNFEYVIGIGQMESNIKQFDKLIDAYSNSILSNQNIHLVLLGDGEQISILKALVKQKNIEEKVHFLGYQNNPYKYLRNAKFFVLSSQNEGLPNVILEALACETPVVSFDCLSGPSEMISHKQNGLLVENQNVQKLTQAMNLFVEDEKLYTTCKENALQSISPFSIEIIGKQWLDLIDFR
jgi:N-acetylgalactosamine-N,N'-diacetylbacillosaminyl-diphospho-undecaprenol 4-alpha-N-acetylgalactosaminyltransferase